ncbi:TPA: hypothetical protein KNR82_004660, partial [Clostridioides difficile]|nr:hypothetical protein [Clostridioides difficile]
MKIKFVIMPLVIFLMVLFVGCQSTKDTEVKAKDTEIKILGTGDLHSILTD